MTARTRDQKTARKALLGLALCMVLLGGVAMAAVTYAGIRLDHNLERVPGAFDGLVDRPVRPTTGRAANALNVLVIGTDRRSDVPTTGTGAQAPAWISGAQRADTIMMLHLSGDRRSASVISIPRDSWVQIPGYGMGKINAAYSYGGASLTIATVEALTGVHVDHLVLADWDGFRSVVDALGGVRVWVPATVYDSARGITWTAGVHDLGGQQALDYVGQRYGLPLGDLDRVRRQQAVVRQITARTLHQDPFRDPVATYRLLDEVTRHVSVDEEWSARDMAGTLMSVSDLETSDIRFVTAPVAGFGQVGAQSIVRLDGSENHALWGAVVADELDDWDDVRRDDRTPAIVR